ncbi:hypothetical protein [Variovorax paradoxus]|uniref:hypothetical protein n=1 Tax=Variovorax paradoxus TaxID=34073 RepID=UPI000649896D|nr:hypothetical protein [Variovorax paradoxus]
MRRRLALVFLLLSVFWQVIAIAGQVTAFAEAEEVGHAMLHWQSEAHHHHDDGSVTQDDSDESNQHVIADGCLSPSAVWLDTAFTFAPAEGTPPPTAGEAAKPAPHLDGLRRPPRLSS